MSISLKMISNLWNTAINTERVEKIKKVLPPALFAIGIVAFCRSKYPVSTASLALLYFIYHKSNENKLRKELKKLNRLFALYFIYNKFNENQLRQCLKTLKHNCQTNFKTVNHRHSTIVDHTNDILEYAIQIDDKISVLTQEIDEALDSQKDRIDQLTAMITQLQSKQPPSQIPHDAIQSMYA